jgi:hypothetical protein
MCPIGFLMLGSTPARAAERFAAASRSALPGDYPTSSRAPSGPPAPTDGSRSPISADHPPHPRPSARSVAESKPPRRSRSSTRASNPGPSGGASRTSMACRTCPQSGWPPASARMRPSDIRLDTVSADQLLLRTPGSDWTGDGHGGPLDRPVGRTPPVQGDRPADGCGPSPDSDGQAADTSNAQRPPTRLASRPRPTTRPAHPGPDRTGRQCACSLRPTPGATSSGTRP